MIIGFVEPAVLKRGCFEQLLDTEKDSGALNWRFPRRWSDMKRGICSHCRLKVPTLGAKWCLRPLCENINTLSMAAVWRGTSGW